MQRFLNVKTIDHPVEYGMAFLVINNEPIMIAPGELTYYGAGSVSHVEFKCVFFDKDPDGEIESTQERVDRWISNEWRNAISITNDDGDPLCQFYKMRLLSATIDLKDGLVVIKFRGDSNENTKK